MGLYRKRKKEGKKKKAAHGFILPSPGTAWLPIACKPFLTYGLADVSIQGSMTAEDAVSHLLMKTFLPLYHSAWLNNLRCVFRECCEKKKNKKKRIALFVCVFFWCSVLSCDSTCLAPCCECSHWAVITHLTAVWNIHSQVSPSLQGSHMDSLLSPPPALSPCHFIPPAFSCASQLLDAAHTATATV